LAAQNATAGPVLLYGLVPNHVATVTLLYPAATPITMRVVNNVFLADEARRVFSPSKFSRPATEVWRARNGRVIKTFKVL
jgi:hypothetical protein